MNKRLYFGTHVSPFGNCLIAWYEQDIYWLSFFDYHLDLKDLKKTFPMSTFIENNHQAHIIINKLFSSNNHNHIYMHGTSFQKIVWQALLSVQPGITKTYHDIAHIIGKPKAVRAVARAIASNRIAYIIPCHRVIRKDGSLGGYRWGIERKKQILTFEKTLF